jgi:hypothetical protein
MTSGVAGQRIDAPGPGRLLGGFGSRLGGALQFDLVRFGNASSWVDAGPAFYCGVLTLSANDESDFARM